MGRIKGRAAQNAKIKTRDTVAEVDDSDLKPPVFSFEYLQAGWCIHDCQQEERSKMLDRLRRISQISWREIRQLDRHAYGTEIIDREILKVGIPSFLTADVKLLAFRAFDLVAMVGYRKGRIFHVIWIDREFKLYAH